MSMTIQSSVKDKILATSSETSKVENASAKMLCDLDQQMEKKADDDAVESVKDAIRFEYCLASSSGWIKSPVLWAEIGESSLIGLELVQEMTDKVVLVTPWKGVVHFGKKGKLAPRYVGLFEILERIGLCLTDANLHVPWDEIKVDKTLHFVEDPIEIMDREIKKLKRRKIALVKVRWNLKCGPEFTWEHEDQMRIRLALPLDMVMCSFYVIKWCAM
ncbi:hypothetical protein Tco_0957168 [Tanacetum coccineum]